MHLRLKDARSNTLQRSRTRLINFSNINRLRFITFIPISHMKLTIDRFRVLPIAIDIDMLRLPE